MFDIAHGVDVRTMMFGEDDGEGLTPRRLPERDESPVEEKDTTVLMNDLHAAVQPSVGRS
jgi:hypothetical protein